FFAQGLAVAANGKERLRNNLTSNGALLLDSRLLNDLPKQESKHYAAGVKAMILGPEFRTKVGIRCRAVRHSSLLPFVDYHGSYAVWPKETFDIARGLERFGYKREATALHADIVRAIQKAGDFYELFY